MFENKIKLFQNRLSSIYNPNEAKSIIILLIKHYSGLSLADILLNKQIDSETEKNIIEALEKVVDEYPVQYVIGETDFYGRKFFLNNNVLIPRNETEELVNIIVKENKNRKINILDIGTGSGCIAISLACELPETKNFAIDISEEALIVAEKNNKQNKASVLLACYDILSNKAFPFDEKFDIIVSNPPYVRESEKAEMRKNVVSHEPHKALFVKDSSPLVFYEACLQLSEKYLNKNGKIYVEINEKLGQETLDLFVKYGFQAEIVKDIAGKDRIIKTN